MQSNNLESPVRTRNPKAKANDLLTVWRAFHDSEDPIDLNGLIKNVVLKQSKVREIIIKKTDLGQTIDGAMSSLGEDRWGLFINKNVRSLGRRRFTLAHELYHFIDHRNLQSTFKCSNNDLSTFDGSTFEEEANTFASQLLIPPDIVRGLDKKLFCYESAKDAADKLKVSVAALAYTWVKISKRRIGFFQSRDGFISKGMASEKAYSNGVYFKSGKELPENCLTNEVQANKRSDQSLIQAGIWHEKLEPLEDVHATFYEDFTYTFLDFNDRY